MGRDTDRPALGQTPLLGGTEPRDYAGGRKHLALARADSAIAFHCPATKSRRDRQTDKQKDEDTEPRPVTC